MPKLYGLQKKVELRTIIKLFSLLLIFFGFSIMLYVFFPLISWQIYFAPLFTNQNIIAPIPKQELISENSVQNLFKSASSAINGVNFDNAKNWFPDYKFVRNNQAKTENFSLSIPKLNIKNAVVSTADYDLSQHLVNYPGTAYPPDAGNAVIFGHSTLPQNFESNNYKTIFSYLYKLSAGDEIVVNSQKVDYKYKVEKIIVVDPENTTVLEQNYDSSFLTLITCTPPGTIWKRLVVKARIERI